MLETGQLLLNIWTSFFAWLSTNIFGSLYMFYIVLIFFTVIFTLGGKNK